MKTKPLLTLAVTLVVGIAIGVIGTQFVTRMNAYTNGSGHTAQARSIMQKIAAYRDKNGVPPDQQWFSSLGDITKTSEGFQWVYLNPPLISEDQHEIVILTATHENNRYLCGMPDYGVVYTAIDNTKQANKAEMATPMKLSD